MSWFKTPVAYKSYSDGTFEIIERRSFLRVGAAVVVAAGLLGGIAFKLATPPPEDSHRARVEIVKRGDVEALYRILPSYHQLDAHGRAQFWASVSHLHVTEMMPFLELQLKGESNDEVARQMRSVLKSLQRHQAKLSESK